MYYRICFQVVDFKELDKAVKNAKSVVVVGGGFLGSELACALGHRGTCTVPHIVSQRNYCLLGLHEIHYPKNFDCILIVVCVFCTFCN